jgi:UDP-galactopyranose mutase
VREREDIILGGGLAGLTAAYTLQQGGESHWQVIERNERVGGLARTSSVDGYLFDYGPHILFTIDSEIEELIRELLGSNFHAQERQAFIYHHAHRLHTRFPFQAHLFGLPASLVKECLLGLVRAVETHARGDFRPRHYEEWMRGVFGDGIAERLMIPYARKIWTVEPSTMDYSWIERRVPTPEVERIIAGALSDAVEQVGATSHFWYTRQGGIEPLPRALGQRVVNVRLGATAAAIEMPERRLLLADGTSFLFDHLVLSTPLCFLPRLFRGLPVEVERACEALRYQGIYCVNLGIDRPGIADQHWVYFYEDSFPFHRLSFPANFSPDTVPAGKSSIATEVAFSRWRPLSRDEAVERTIDALIVAGILDKQDRIELIHTEEIHPAYVIYDLEHGKNVELIRSYLREHKIFPVGRFGEWQYFNMDHSMRSGMKAAREILASRRKSVPAGGGDGR